MTTRWKLALHTVSYSGSWGQESLSLDDALLRARSLGFDGVMLMAKRPHASPLDLDADGRRRLRARLDELGLGAPCVAGYNDFALGAGRSDIPALEMGIAYIAELCRLARDIGSPLVRIFTAFEPSEGSHGSLWRTVVSGLKEAARRARDLGVTLAVQNHHDLAVHHLALADLLAEVDEPGCRAAFDAWAPALQGADLAAAVRALAPWIVHTTAADYAPRPRFRYRPDLVQYAAEPAEMRMVPFGEGIVDYPAFFGALEEVGYGGWVGFEMCAPLLGGGSGENLDRQARRFKESLERRD